MIAFFHKVIDVLEELEIPYMLSGSVAMSLYIVPRSTRDFDFIVHIQPDKIEAFVKKFENNYYCDIDAIKDAIKFKSLFNIIDHQSGYKADFVILKNENFRQEEFNRKAKLMYFDRMIFVVSIEDLILSKILWIQTYQSAMQMEDIKNLLQASNIDKDYLMNWINILKISTFNLI